MRALIALSALALAASAQASPTTGLNPDEARRFSAERAGESLRADTLDLASERFRAGMVLNPDAFLKTQSPIEQQAIRMAFGQVGPREATHIAWFFRGAVARVEPKYPIVTWYNPLADVAAMGAWRKVDGVWRLIGVRLLDGADTRSVSRDYWADAAATPYRQALAERSAATFHARTLYVIRLSTAAGFERLKARSNAIQGGLAALRADPSRTETAELIRARLARGQVSGEGPTSAQMAALPQDVRRTLVTVAAFRRADGDTLVFASPLAPALLLFVDLDGAGRPVRTGAVNLANLANGVRP